MPRPGGTRHMGGGRSVSGHRIGGSFYQHSAGPFSSSRPGGAYRSTLPSQRSSGGGGFGMGGLSGPILYEMGRMSGRRQSRGGFGGPSYGGGPAYGGNGPVYSEGPSYGGPNYGGGQGYGGQGAGGGGRGCSPGCLTVILVVCAVLLLLTAMGAILPANEGGQSTIERHKIEGVPAFNKLCLTDEIYWVHDGDEPIAGMKDFYDQTGVQPYFVFKKYDASLTTDSQKDAWAAAYYEKRIEEENAFLVIYFAEADTNNDVGYLTQVTGTQAKSVMDKEALQIYWNNLDRYWAGNYSTEEVIAKTYRDTASTIMRVSTTSKDVTKWFLITVLALGVLLSLLLMLRERNRRAKEKAEETERILKTPLEKYSDKESEELIDKYSDKKEAAAGSAEEAAQAESTQAAQAETRYGESAQQDYREPPDIKLYDESKDPMRTATDDLIDKYKDPQ